MAAASPTVCWRVETIQTDSTTVATTSKDSLMVAPTSTGMHSVNATPTASLKAMKTGTDSSKAYPTHLEVGLRNWAHSTSKAVMTRWDSQTVLAKARMNHWAIR